MRSQIDHSQNTQYSEESQLERLCRDAGLKMTGQRQVITRILSEATGHPDAAEVHQLAIKENPKISLTTVYRTVKLLEDHGILERLDLGGDRARYEPAHHGVHYHLLNSENEEVVEFDNDELTALLHRIVEKMGFKLLSHKVELIGTSLPKKED
ncbi:transcriptional repressor [Acetobacteraceae bacterium]|nr:transcriptional repressor [Acetobacteraceae bacterium]